MTDRMEAWKVEQEIISGCSTAVTTLSRLRASLDRRLMDGGGSSSPAAVAVRCTPGGARENAVVVCRQGVQNDTLGKLLGSLGAACKAAEDIQDEAMEHVYPLLLMTGESPPEEGDPYADGIAQSRLAPGIGSFLRAATVADTAVDIAVNCISQLAALSSESQLMYGTFKRESVHLISVIRSAGAALAVVARVDAIVNANPGVSRSLSLFRGMLDAIEESSNDASGGEGGTGGPNLSDIDALHDAMDRIESRFASGSPLLIRVLQDRLSSGSSFQANGRLLRCIRGAIAAMLSPLQARIGGADERIGDRDELLNLAILVVVHYWIAVGEPADVKLTKHLFDSFKLAPMVCAFNEVGICLPDLLQTHLPSWSTETLPRDADRLGASFLEDAITQLDSKFVTEMGQIKVSIDCWCLGFLAETDGTLGRACLGDDHISRVLTLMVQGVHMANRAKTLMTDVSMLHVRMARPLSIVIVRALGRGLELLKGIKGVFEKYSLRLATGAMLQLSRLVQKMMFSIVHPVRAGLQARLSGASSSGRGGRSK